MAREKKAVITATIKNMKSLGIYKKEYKDLIEIYAEMISQYEHFSEKFTQGGLQVEVEYVTKTGNKQTKKTPTFLAMENLRRDIATYSDKLGLNPKTSQNMITETPKHSKLEEALKNIG